ncbi:hypothetical protein QQ045_001236 [Rhodiola kirilowii]
MVINPANNRLNRRFLVWRNASNFTKQPSLTPNSNFTKRIQFHERRLASGDWRLACRSYFPIPSGERRRSGALQLKLNLSGLADLSLSDDF